MPDGGHPQPVPAPDNRIVQVSSQDAPHVQRIIQRNQTISLRLRSTEDRSGWRMDYDTVSRAFIHHQPGASSLKDSSFMFYCDGESLIGNFHVEKGVPVPHLCSCLHTTQEDADASQMLAMFCQSVDLGVSLQRSSFLICGVLSQCLFGLGESNQGEHKPTPISKGDCPFGLLHFGQKQVSRSSQASVGDQIIMGWAVRRVHLPGDVSSIHWTKVADTSGTIEEQWHAMLKTSSDTFEKYFRPGMPDADKVLEFEIGVAAALTCYAAARSHLARHQAGYVHLNLSQYLEARSWYDKLVSSEKSSQAETNQEATEDETDPAVNKKADMALLVDGVTRTVDLRFLVEGFLFNPTDFRRTLAREKNGNPIIATYGRTNKVQRLQWALAAAEDEQWTEISDNREVGSSQGRLLAESSDFSSRFEEVSGTSPAPNTVVDAKVLHGNPQSAGNVSQVVTPPTEHQATDFAMAPADTADASKGTQPTKLTKSQKRAWRRKEKSRREAIEHDAAMEAGPASQAIPTTREMEPLQASTTPASDGVATVTETETESNPRPFDMRAMAQTLLRPPTPAAQTLPAADEESDNDTTPRAAPPSQHVDPVSGAAVFRFDNFHPLSRCWYPECRKMTSCYDSSVKACPACGPRSFVRYCSKECLYKDIRHHYDNHCGRWEIKGAIDEATLQGDNFAPRFFLRPAIGLDTVERHRQAVWYAMEGDSNGDYFLFDDIRHAARLPNGTISKEEALRVRGRGDLVAHIRIPDRHTVDPTDLRALIFRSKVTNMLSWGFVGGSMTRAMQEACVEMVAVIQAALAADGRWNSETCTNLCMQVAYECGFQVPRAMQL